MKKVLRCIDVVIIIATSILLCGFMYYYDSHRPVEVSDYNCDVYHLYSVGGIEGSRISANVQNKEINELLVQNEVQFISYVNNSGTVSRGLVKRDEMAIASEKIYNYIKAKNPSLSDGQIIDIRQSILNHSQEHNFDPLLVAALICVESRFNELAESYAGAQGIMQIMPATARGVAEGMGLSSYNLFNYENNITIGTECLDIYVNSWKNISQIDSRNGNNFNNVQMGILSYNGSVRLAKNLENLEYLYSIEDEYTALKYTSLYE